MRKLRSQKLRSEEYTELAILDELRIIRWLLTKDAEKGRNRPESMLMKMLKLDEKPRITGFRTPEEFEARRKIIAGE